MSESNDKASVDKVPLPPYLQKRLEAFRVGADGSDGYILRDSHDGRTYSLETWQFQVLDALRDCDSFAKLALLPEQRFGVPLRRRELDALFAWLSDDCLLGEDARGHRLLAPFYDRANGTVDAGQLAVSPEMAKQINQSVRELSASLEDYLSLDESTEAYNSMSLFDPRRMLDVVTPWLRACRFAVWLLPFMVVAMVFTISDHSGDFISDIRYLYHTVALIEHMIFSMLTIDIITQLLYASTAHYYGLAVNEVSMTIYFFFLPRIRARVNHVKTIPRRQQMWIQSAPLLGRLGLMSFGVLTWYHARVYSLSEAYIGLGLFIISTVDLMFASGNPFSKGSFYKLMTAALNMPSLRGDAFAVIYNLWYGRPQKIRHPWPLGIYGVCIVVYMFVLVYFIEGLVSGGLLDMRFGNLAIVVTAALVIKLVVGQFNRLAKIRDADLRAQAYQRWKARAMPEAVTGKNIVAADDTEPSHLRYALRAMMLSFLVILVLPYPYQPGGNFSIYPARQAQISPDVDGIVDAVYFDGGERVKKGTLIAKLRDDDNAAKVRILDADVREQTEIIDNLKTLPKPEAIKVAQAALDTAATHEQFSHDKLPRYDVLYKQGAISFDEIDALRRQHNVDLDQVSQRRAALVLVEAGPTVDEIAAAEGKLKSLEEQRDAYQDLVNRASLYMPFDGTITTLHLKNKLNSFLPKGAVFANVVDDSSMTAEIDVPETELAGVAVGEHLHARANAFFDRQMVGTLTTIDAGVTRETTGNVVKVIGLIPNTDGRLTAGMTGYAKIDSPYVPVWKAFTYPLINYWNINVWSWVP